MRISIKRNELRGIIREHLKLLQEAIDETADMKVIIEDVHDDLDALYKGIPPEYARAIPKFVSFVKRWMIFGNTLVNSIRKRKSSSSMSDEEKAELAGDEKNAIEEINDGIRATQEELKAAGAKFLLERFNETVKKAEKIIKKFVEKTEFSTTRIPASSEDSSSIRSIYNKIMSLNSKSSKFMALKEKIIEAIDDINTFGLNDALISEAGKLYIGFYKLLLLYCKLYDGADTDVASVKSPYEGVKKMMKDFYINVVNEKKEGRFKSEENVQKIRQILEVIHKELSAENKLWVDTMKTRWEGMSSKERDSTRKPRYDTSFDKTNLELSFELCGVITL